MAPTSSSPSAQSPRPRRLTPTACTRYPYRPSRDTYPYPGRPCAVPRASSHAQRSRPSATTSTDHHPQGLRLLPTKQKRLTAVLPPDPAGRPIPTRRVQPVRTPTPPTAPVAHTRVPAPHPERGKLPRAIAANVAEVRRSSERFIKFTAASSRGDARGPALPSPTSTTATATQQQQQQQHSPQHSLYKTELCRSYEETGTCRYGAKCQVRLFYFPYG